MSGINLAEDLVPLTEAKKNLSELCERAVSSGRSFLLTKHGRGLVAVVPVESFMEMVEYRKAVELERALSVALEQIRSGEVDSLEDVESGLSSMKP